MLNFPEKQINRFSLFNLSLIKYFSYKIQFRIDLEYRKGEFFFFFSFQSIYLITMKLI